MNVGIIRDEDTGAEAGEDADIEKRLIDSASELNCSSVMSYVNGFR